MKCLVISIGLLISVNGLAIWAPVATANHHRRSHSVSHNEAMENAADADPYTKLCGEVALTIEGKVNWTGSAKGDADTALVVLRQELAKIDSSTAPAGLTGPFDPEWFQVHVGNILAMDADPYDLDSGETWNVWNTEFNNEFRKGLHHKKVEVLQLCRHSVIGWPDAPHGLFGLRTIQVAPI
jgi:hypothetical protein